ncbi:MAG: tyrosine-protein phosphatase [Bacilli bacterium]|nr:tyrosine-protein phosphatase [Bacilli bacterium]
MEKITVEIIDGQPVIYGEVLLNNDTITKYGHIRLFEDKNFIKRFFSHGDMLTIELLDKKFDLPYVITFTDVDCYELEIVDINDFGTFIAMNFADICKYLDIAYKEVYEDNSYQWVGKQPIISYKLYLKEKGAYKEKMNNRTVGIYSIKREDFPHLSDEQFANFRPMEQKSAKPDFFFRIASPIDNLFGRAKYADEILKKHEIVNIINLADDATSVHSFPAFEGSYYKTMNRLELCMGIDFHNQEFKDKFRQIINFLAENPGKTAINCIEGKDRTGIVSALLECLLDYSLEDIEDDYMVSFYNYYGVKKGDPRYDAIKQNIAIQLKYAFECDELYDLNSQAREYFLNKIAVKVENLNKAINNLHR